MKDKRVLLSIEELTLIVSSLEDWIADGFWSDKDMLLRTEELKNDLKMVIAGVL